MAVKVKKKEEGLILCPVFTCSVKGVVGVEDCREEAEGESADAEGHVKAGVPETLEHLCTDRRTD